MNRQMCQALVGRTIRVDRGGPNSTTGTLLAVGDNFLTLFTEEDGVIYVSMKHIKSITEKVKNANSYPLEIPANIEFKMNNTLTSLLKDMKYQWVRINKGGPEKIEGILHDCNEDYIVLVCNDEVIRIATYHIKNISYGPVQQEEQ